MDAFQFIRIDSYTPDAFIGFEGHEVVISDRFVMFWNTPSPFDQWTIARFLVDGVEYVCPEQYMMASKARLFGDSEIERQILSTESPKEHKRLGRAVRGFDESVWNESRCKIVRTANMAKFSQNLELKKLLLETGDRDFVEASPFDKIWGIGLTANKPAAYDRSTWKGLNLLGDILNDVRLSLKASVD
jgi:ribA/ribD-fused uncharacterized protein